MAAARADPLRSTLDNLQLDPRSEADRPYLVAMLRRLGYTEREIEEVVRTGRMPEQPPADDGMAPPRDFRLVVPARDTRFALDNTASAAADSPFEDLERVEFEDPAEDLVFEEVQPGQEAAAEEAGAPLEWQTTEEGPETASAPDERLSEARGEGDEARQAGGPGEEGAQPLSTGFEESAIDTFGSAEAVEGATQRKTRVRVRRVRAASREDAERKVGSRDRKVLKAVPVDIVERWGANQSPPPGQPPKDGGKKEG